jgi:hypothetical protein
MLRLLNLQAKPLSSQMLSMIATIWVWSLDMCVNALYFLHTRENLGFSFFPFFVSHQLALP